MEKLTEKIMVHVNKNKLSIFTSSGICTVVLWSVHMHMYYFTYISDNNNNNNNASVPS